RGDRHGLGAPPGRRDAGAPALGPLRDRERRRALPGRSEPPRLLRPERRAAARLSRGRSPRRRAELKQKKPNRRRRDIFLKNEIVRADGRHSPRIVQVRIGEKTWRDTEPPCPNSPAICSSRTAASKPP